MTLTVGSLFSGIGGLDLGLERAGMNVIWQSEIDPYACRVLKKHWPEVPNHGDIKRIDWRNIVRPDVICGGYPCQPFSHAGKRQGEEDPRHLWPWVREAIRVLRPRYAILENVRGHLSLGGSTVISEITALGYDCEWRIVSAASVGANHRRDRIIIVAYPNRQNEPNGALNEFGMVADTDSERMERPRPEQQTAGFSGKSEIVADAHGGNAADGGQRQVISGKDRSRGNERGGSNSDPREITVRGSGQNPGDVADADGYRSQTQRGTGRHETSLSPAWGNGADLADAESRVDVRRDGCSREDRGEIFGGDNLSRGTSGYEGWQWWQIEPDVGRVAYGIPNRVDRLKGLGNAVVPQVAEIIGRLVVNHYERMTA